MNALLVLAHPEPQSFNAALFNRAKSTLEAQGYTVATSDLYRMGFNPVSGRRNFSAALDPDFLKLQAEEIHAAATGGFAADLDAEMRKVEAADLVILHFPLWWFGMPAILKGWVDRVFASGRFYGSGRMYEQGIHANKRAMLTITTGGPQSLYGPGDWHGDIDAILRPIQRGILQFLGFQTLPPALFFSPARVDDDARIDMLNAYAARLTSIANEAPLPPLNY